MVYRLSHTYLTVGSTFYDLVSHTAAPNDATAEV